jgi:large subunit ribosomal protein L6
VSRIGKLPVEIPANVEVTVDGQLVKVLGPRGALEHRVAEPIKVNRGENGDLRVTRPDAVATLWASIALAAFIVFSHRANIQRLLAGTENRFRTRKELR